MRNSLCFAKIRHPPPAAMEDMEIVIMSEDVELIDYRLWPPTGTIMMYEMG